MQHRLASAAGGQPGADLPATWGTLSDVAAGLAASDGPRWLDIPYEALLNAGPAEEALQQLGNVLAADNGAGLIRLIDVTRRHARPQNSGGSTSGPSGPELDVVLSAPVLALLAGLAGQLPAGVRAAATRLMCSHLRSLLAPPDGTPDERLPRAGELPAVLMAWAQDDQLDRQERDTAEALAMLEAYLDADGEQFLLAYADEEPDSIGRALEEPLASPRSPGSVPSCCSGWRRCTSCTTTRTPRRSVPRARLRPDAASALRENARASPRTRPVAPAPALSMTWRTRRAGRLPRCWTRTRSAAFASPAWSSMLRPRPVRAPRQSGGSGNSPWSSGCRTGRSHGPTEAPPACGAGTGGWGPARSLQCRR